MENLNFLTILYRRESNENIEEPMTTKHSENNHIKTNTLTHFGTMKTANSTNILNFSNSFHTNDNQIIYILKVLLK